MRTLSTRCVFPGRHSSVIKDDRKMHIRSHLKCDASIYVCVRVCVPSTSSCMPHSNSIVTHASMGKAISLPLIFRCSSRDLPNDGFSTHASATKQQQLESHADTNKPLLHHLLPNNNPAYKVQRQHSVIKSKLKCSFTVQCFSGAAALFLVCERKMFYSSV